MTEPKIGDTKIMDGGTIWRLTEHDDKGDVWEQIGEVGIGPALPKGGFRSPVFTREEAFALLEKRCAEIDQHYERYPNTPDRSMAETATAIRILLKYAGRQA